MGTSYLGADPVIRRGIDVFTTTANGTTFYDFSKSPIPAGFFCEKSKPFRGRVVFKGLPLETERPGQLRGADTVIERLDDAVFKANDTAVTRVRFRALSLVSVSPIRTGCGAYHAYVSLAGPQRITKMRIRRTHEGGGTFSAPLAVNVRLTFIPVNASKARSPRKLELLGDFTFPASPLPWGLSAGAGAKRINTAFVDTNGDLTPDTQLSGTTNFFPGWSRNMSVPKACYLCEPKMCHTDPATGKEHCSGPIYACNGTVCP
jgi:hypothetical protein